LPEVEQVPGTDGALKPKLDGSKAPKCKQKCTKEANKYRAEVAKQPRSCTQSSQCRSDEVCAGNPGRCMKH